MKALNKSTESRPSTKARSLGKVPTQILQTKIYEFVKANPNVSRREISNQTKIYLSSVTARVNELCAKNAVTISGQKYDAETRRNVETIVVVA